MKIANQSQQQQATCQKCSLEMQDFQVVTIAGRTFSIKMRDEVSKYKGKVGSFLSINVIVYMLILYLRNDELGIFSGMNKKL